MKKYEKIGRVTSSSVHKGTGRHWPEWIKLLNKAGAKTWTHSEIAKYLALKFKLTPWWQQGVAVGYEIAAGKRIEGQNHKGEYGLTVTRTYPFATPHLWKVLNSAEGIQAWLNPLSELKLKPEREFEIAGGVFGEVRTVKTGERIRLSWRETDGPAKSTFVTLSIVPRSKDKAIFVIQHDGLKTSRQKEELRVYWKSRIDALSALLDR